MAWYYGTFSCGHEGRIDIVGPTKNRQWRADRNFEGLCAECAEKRKEEARKIQNDIAKKEAKEFGYPELIGSEKQVSWANTIRSDMARDFTRWIDRAIIDKKNDAAKHLSDVMQYVLKTKTKASWFIDNRGIHDLKLVKIIEEEMNAVEENDRMDEIVEESTVKPDNIKYQGVVRISGNDKEISAEFEKNENFRAIVHSLDLRWDRDKKCWSRELNEYTGPFSERAAELGSKLLTNGFAVSILDPNVISKAVAGNFIPESKRWVKCRVKEKKFALLWKRDDNSDTIYSNARKIPTSIWDSPSVLVDVSHYQEVEEFADMYGFTFSKAALKMRDNYIKQFRDIETVTPDESVKIEPVDKLKEILNSSGSILEDLKDDE